ncbi:MAG: glycosyltransferase family 2 protein [Planctomycetota bacterium]|jgi:glycosyltransferase involved in cell wall biosynthesis
MSDQAHPTFSVIMPVYNHVDYVGEAIHSVLDQTLGDWELIIVDDGSTDGSGELVDELAARDDRIRVFHQENAGPSAARNLALSVARGAWLAYIDSDDAFLPDALQNYAAYIAAHPRTRFIHGYRHRLNEDGSITELAGEFQDRPSGTHELFGRMFLSHLCVCYRRELIELSGGYDESLRSCEDYELYLRLSLMCRFDPLGKPTGLRRRHATNLSTQTGASRFLEAQILQRFVDHHGAAVVMDDKFLCRRLGRLYYASARQYFKAHDYAHAVDAIDQSHRWCRTCKGLAISLMSRILHPWSRPDAPPVHLGEQNIPRPMH